MYLIITDLDNFLIRIHFIIVSGFLKQKFRNEIKKNELESIMKSIYKYIYFFNL